MDSKSSTTTTTTTTDTEEMTNDMLDLSETFRSVQVHNSSDDLSLGRPQDHYFTSSSMNFTEPQLSMDSSSLDLPRGQGEYFTSPGTDYDEPQITMSTSTMVARSEEGLGFGAGGTGRHVFPPSYAYQNKTGLGTGGGFGDFPAAGTGHTYQNMKLLGSIPDARGVPIGMDSQPMSGTEKEPWMNSVFLKLDKKKFLSSLASISADALEQPHGGSELLKLEPLPPYYEEYSSFRCRPHTDAEKIEQQEQDMVDEIFSKVEAGLDELSSICNYRSKKDKFTIRGICYKDDNNSAHWKMKIFRCRSNESEVAELLVEFSKRQGDTITFHHFYTSLFNTAPLYALRGMEKPKESKETSVAFGRGMDLEWPADLDDDMTQDQTMDKETISALHAWAKTDLIDQRKEGMRVMATLLEEPANRKALWIVKEGTQSGEDEQNLVDICVEGFRTEDPEVQRLCSIALNECTGYEDNGYDGDEKICANFSDIANHFHHAQLKSGEAQMPLEAIQTYRQLSECLGKLGDKVKEKSELGKWEEIHKMMEKYAPRKDAGPGSSQ